MKIRDIIKSILPPFILNLIKKYFLNRKYGWHGDYPSWEAAKARCKGYDADEIINKVRNSLLKVKNGEAVYERDSVLFDEIQYSWPVLSGLLWVAAQNGGRLNVLDFGGSLGSSYFQNKAFLDHLSDVKWNIVEQEKFVNIGKKDFEDESLRFYLTIIDCIKANEPNVVLLSSVIQYVENPYELLTEIFKYNIDTIVIDLTGFTSLDRDLITTQKVHPDIYPASYPCWFFSKNNFKLFYENYGYKDIAIFNSHIGKNLNISNTQAAGYEGYILYREKV